MCEKPKLETFEKIQHKQELVAMKAKGLAKWFRVSVSIEIFGKVIWSFTWPPQNQ